MCLIVFILIHPMCNPPPPPSQFIGGGREASTEHHAQAGWLFWPGGWHAGQGWWADSDVEYTLEAATMRDEVYVLWWDEGRDACFFFFFLYWVDQFGEGPCEYTWRLFLFCSLSCIVACDTCSASCMNYIRLPRKRSWWKRKRRRWRPRSNTQNAPKSGTTI